VAHFITVGSPLNTDWFMQNGATPHGLFLTCQSAQAEFPTVIEIAMDVKRVRHAVIMTFSVISLWLPLNIDNSQSTPASAMELSALIVDICCDITEGACRRAMRNVKVLVPEIVRQKENM
jgi:hypothetical protein